MKFLVVTATAAAVLLIICSAEEACSFEDVRLYTNGTVESNKRGMLQICDHNGQWTAVCDHDWQQSMSVTVCNQLGHNNSTPYTTLNAGGSWSSMGYVSNHYYYSFWPPYCDLSRAITGCLTNSSVYLGSSYYCNRHWDTVNIDCTFNITAGCSYGDIRLYSFNDSSAVNNTGMLQICDGQGRWTAVCDYNWRCLESIVACKQLGFSSIGTRYIVDAGTWPLFGFGPYSCSSQFGSNLLSCVWSGSQRLNSLTDCNPLYDTIGLVCSSRRAANQSCSNSYQVRLVNGRQTSSTMEGRVEICYNGEWTPMCNDHFGSSYSNNVLATLCNSLGNLNIVHGYASAVTDGRYDSSLAANPITSVLCLHPYHSIRSCSISQYTNCYSSSCTSSFGLKCYLRENCNEGEVRLANGTLEREGRLEVCTNGAWGGVCADSGSFRKSLAHVACKQAGYKDVMGSVIYQNNQFGVGNGLIVYRNVDCFGHETLLSDCTKIVYPNFTCSSQLTIGLLCRDNCSYGDVRLVGGRHGYEGFVEICLDSIWTLVAQSGWDNSDARIICKQLKVYNFSAGMAVWNTSNFTKPRRAVRYTNIYCRGSENQLTECIHNTLDFDTGRLYRADVAAVNCGVTVAVISSSTSSSHGMAMPIPTPFTQTQTDIQREDHAVLGTGVGLLVLAITILVTGIVIMVCIVGRMRKLSISKSGRNSDQQQMSSLHDQVNGDYDTLNGTGEGYTEVFVKKTKVNSKINEDGNNLLT